MEKIENVSPSKVQQVVKAGFNRLRHYRRARAMFLRDAVGPYYRDKYGRKGEEPINLIFTALRTIIPNIVQRNPVSEVTTDFMEHDLYAELLSLGLDQVAKEIDLKATLRAWVASAMFGFGVIKTGICDSGTQVTIGNMTVDPGQLYSSLVDLDNFVFDPTCTDLKTSSLYGDRVRVPRIALLDDAEIDSDLVMKIPSVSQSVQQDTKNVASMTQDSRLNAEMQELQDEVAVVELWIPGADAKIMIPDPNVITFKDYLKVADFYGPDEGPYDYLSFAPPVDNNPLPVAPISVIYDLHRSANRVFSKLIDQSDRQRDVLLYDPAHSDTAQDIVDAQDGDSIASSDPSKVNLLSYGGQNKMNVEMIHQLQVWFNYMAGNPDQLSGTQSNARTATQAQILQSNASVSLDDARDILYDATASVQKKHAWYIHTDPLLDRTFKRRERTGEVTQLHLTPEQRSGDFLQFAFKVVQKSMGSLSPEVRSKRIVEYCTNILPGIVNTAMQMAQLGLPFNVQKCATEMGNQLEIGDWVNELFVDPDFQQKMQMILLMGPQNPGKAGGMPGMQNGGGLATARPVPGEGQIMNENAQMTAGQGQSTFEGVM
jgi:hypothetical protein